MGRVRSSHIKRLARRLVEENPEFNKDFENNKEILKEMGELKSKKLRNRVAGYIVKVIENKRF